MKTTITDALNFLPGWKRIITIAAATVIFAVAQFGIEIPDYVFRLLELFGFNALAQAPKNT